MSTNPVNKSLLAARLAFQRDRRTLARLAEEAQATAAVHQTALRLSAQIPGIDLAGRAATEERRATDDAEWAAGRVRSSADALVAAHGFAVAA